MVQVLENSPKKNENKENKVIVYDILRSDNDKEITGVPRSKLKSRIQSPSLELLKIFIRAHSRKYKNHSDMPWVVDEPYLSMHEVHELKYRGDAVKSDRSLIGRYFPILKH